MKRFIFLLMVSLMVIFGLSACNDENNSAVPLDQDEVVGQGDEANNQKSPNTERYYTDEGDKVSLYSKVEGEGTEIAEYTFSDNKISSVNYILEFNDEEKAKSAYDAYQSKKAESEQAANIDIQLDGNKITLKFPVNDQLKDTTKDQIISDCESNGLEKR